MNNFKPGQVYYNPESSRGLRREILFVTNRHVLTCNEETKSEQLWEKTGIQHWVLAPEVKKAYVSVWKNNKYTWSVSSVDKKNYDTTTNKYKVDGYTLLKEYVLEYEDSNEVR